MSYLIGNLLTLLLTALIILPYQAQYVDLSYFTEYGMFRIWYLPFEFLVAFPHATFWGEKKYKSISDEIISLELLFRIIGVFVITFFSGQSYLDSVLFGLWIILMFQDQFTIVQLSGLNLKYRYVSYKTSLKIGQIIGLLLGVKLNLNPLIFALFIQGIFSIPFKIKFSISYSKHSFKYYISNVLPSLPQFSLGFFERTLMLSGGPILLGIYEFSNSFKAVISTLMLGVRDWYLSKLEMVKKLIFWTVFLIIFGLIILVLQENWIEFLPDTIKTHEKYSSELISLIIGWGLFALFGLLSFVLSKKLLSKNSKLYRIYVSTLPLVMLLTIFSLRAYSSDLFLNFGVIYLITSTIVSLIFWHYSSQ